MYSSIFIAKTKVKLKNWIEKRQVVQKSTLYVRHKFKKQRHIGKGRNNFLIMSRVEASGNPTGFKKTTGGAGTTLPTILLYRMWLARHGYGQNTEVSHFQRWRHKVGYEYFSLTRNRDDSLILIVSNAEVFKCADLLSKTRSL